MSNRICPNLKSFLPSSSRLYDGAVVTGLAGIGCAVGGIVGATAAIAGIGTYYALNKWGGTRNDPIELAEPKGAPPKFTNGGNCCFLSTTLWAILNEPTILKELPNAIARRCDSPPKDKRALLKLYSNLQRLEKKGPIKDEKTRELLSLLELYVLVDHCQSSDGAVGADQINNLRKTVQRVLPTFTYMGRETGDSQEVFNTLADLIFKDSPLSRDLYTVRHCKPPKDASYQLEDDDGVHPVRGEIQRQEKNWGRFEISAAAVASIQKILNKSLVARDEYEAKFSAKGYEEKKPFIVTREEVHIYKPPELLAITVKRYADPNVQVPADEILQFDRPFLNGANPMYELYSVINRHGAAMSSFGHYTADVKRDGKWYHCNDVGTVVEPTETPASDTAYMLFYRKIH